MSECDPVFRSGHERIEWAQAHGVREAFDRPLRFTEVDSDPAAERPCSCQIWIEHECPIDESYTVVEFADDIGERDPGPRERHRVLLAELNRPSSQPCSFGILLTGSTIQRRPLRRW